MDSKLCRTDELMKHNQEQSVKDLQEATGYKAILDELKDLNKRIEQLESNFFRMKNSLL